MKNGKRSDAVQVGKIADATLLGKRVWVRATVQGSARLEGASMRIASGAVDIDARLNRILKG